MKENGSRARSLAESVSADGQDLIGIDFALNAARRQFSVIVIGILIGLVVGSAHLMVAQRLYTATARVLVDGNQRGAIKDVSPYGDVTLDATAVESEVVVAASEKVAGMVVDKLFLQNDREFNSSDASVLSRLIGGIQFALDVRLWFRNPELDMSIADSRRVDAIQRLRSALVVSRLRGTYVIEVKFTSRSRQKAAKIANAVADAYITEQLVSRFDETRRAGDWLQTRIRELRDQTLEADLKIQEFKTANNLVSASGTLVNEQQLTQTSKQFIEARETYSNAVAKFSRLQLIISSGDPDAADPQALQSAIIGNLRDSYLKASKLYRELTPKLGPEHEQIQKLDAEMKSYKQLIFDELSRIADVYKSEVDVSKRKLDSLSSSMTELSDLVNANGNELAELRALQSEADSLRAMYQSLLERYQGAVQGQSFPVSSARIITNATSPAFPSFPRPKPFLAFYALVGLFLGAAVGGLREFFDRGFRRAEQAESDLGLTFLGMVPSVARLVDIDEPKNFNYLMNIVTENPLSAFAETLRSLKVTTDANLPGKDCRVLGFISAFPGEGKTTLAKNFASSVAQSGARTLLIDGDLRKHTLSSLFRDEEQGLVDVVADFSKLKTAMKIETTTNLHILPSGVKDRIANSSQILSSPALADVIQQLRSEYAYIIFDLPPIGPVIDARAGVNLFDGFFMVVAWGQTPRSGASACLLSQPALHERCIGVIYNKVDQYRLHLYDYYGSYYYSHGGYYSRYGYNQSMDVHERSFPRRIREFASGASHLWGLFLPARNKFNPLGHTGSIDDGNGKRDPSRRKSRSANSSDKDQV